MRKSVLAAALALVLLCGCQGAESETEAEAPLAAQVGVNQRVLKQLVEIDRAVNRKLAREKSIYQ